MPPAASRRACDRCNSLKERCSWQQEQGAAAASCARCNRLGFECLLKRPAKKPGRPRLFSSSARVSNETRQAGSNSSKSSYEGEYLMRLHPASNPIIPRSLSQFKDLSSSDQHLIQYILFGDHAFDVFLIGPSFWTQHRTFLVSQFLISRQTLQDACLALALIFKQHSAVASVRSDDSTSYKHASSALKHLREYTIPSGRGVSECLALGALILSFTYYCSPSTDAVPVCSQTLSLVKETYESRDTFFSSKDLVFIPCFILPEIVDCLMRGSLPTLRFRQLPGLDDDVDRYTGLFSSLLPHLYDICKLNNGLSHANPDDLDNILEAVDRIDQSITAWRPLIPEDFNFRFTATEISQILCQAQVMRLGAMLLIHRLRHPFGTNNGPALAMATAILTQLDLTRAATNRNILSITLPLLAACFEIQDEHERQTWLSRIPELVGYSLAFSNYVQSLVKTFWEALDDMHEMSWYNIDLIIGLYH